MTLAVIIDKGGGVGVESDPPPSPGGPHIEGSGHWGWYPCTIVRQGTSTTLLLASEAAAHPILACSSEAGPSKLGTYGRGRQPKAGRAR